ncbi:MAG: hypothetical protein OXE44_08845 [Nitrospinae bacterium]|nr:hypothetical protein [Nitrospinota bacterium]
MRKILMVLMRGLADRPVADFGGETPLQRARTPALDRLADAGFSGVWAPGSDDVYPSLEGFLNQFFGYSASLSSGLMLAAAADLLPGAGEAVFRLNFVCLKPGATSVVMLDPTGFGVTDEENRELIAYLEQHMPPDEGESFRFESLGGSEALLFYQREGARLSPESFHGFAPPHAITGRSIGEHMPEAEAARRFVHFVNDSQMVLSTHAGLQEKAQTRMFAANSVWLWGGGLAEEAVRMSEKTGGRDSALITDSQLARGFAKLGGADVYEPGEEVSATVREALTRHDFVCLIEDADDISPWREPEEKIEAIEKFDAGLMAPLLEGMSEPCRILVAGDHGFSVESQEWIADPVPFAMADFAGGTLAPPKRPGGLASLWEMIRGDSGMQKNSNAGFSEELGRSARVYSLDTVKKRLFSG